MKLKLPSRLICRIHAPFSMTAKYVPAILSPRLPSSSAKARPACPETKNVATAISATAATNIDHLWVPFICLSSACVNNEPSPLFSSSLGNSSLGSCQRTVDGGGALPFGANLVPKHPDTFGILAGFFIVLDDGLYGAIERRLKVR